MTTADIERIMRGHSQGHSDALLDAWLTPSTLSRFGEWVPAPAAGEHLLVDIGCYQPAIGYYAALGWPRVLGVAKEEGEGSVATSYRAGAATDATIAIADVETEALPVADASADVVLMMEILEHFGLDPMHALAEANRVLKPGGRLVLSTPNATSFDSLRRLIRGSGPFAGLEFSGFSTNRHNRLYDVHELRAVLTAAGFSVDQSASRSYRSGGRDWRRSLFEGAWGLRDAWARRRGRVIERGDYLFVRATKRGPVSERFPPVLYFDPRQWPEWFQAIRRQ
jgi:SAM-dependent methyltransferase